MEKFKITIKEAVKKWNEKNPTLKQKNSSRLAEEIGVDKSYISNIGKKQKHLSTHLEVIFDSEDTELIKQNWAHYTTLGIIIIDNLEKIRLLLECEIYDIITKNQ